MSGPSPTGYTVPPFRGPRYHENRDRCGGDEWPCAICGKPIREPARAINAIVIEGGDAWGDETSDQDDPGYMGAFPVGPDCHRRYRIRQAQSDHV